MHQFNVKVGSTIRFITFVTTCILLGLSSGKTAIAQSAFLASPYYGEKNITQNYSAGHPAIDFGMNYEVVLSAADGTVDTVTWWSNNCHNSATWPNDDDNCGFGLHARIDYGNNYRSWYAHLSSVAFGFGTTNGTIKRGQILGMSGNTGWSTGAHLHLQVQNRVNNQWINVNPNSPNLWEDGQWANPSRPIAEPVNGGEVQIDDNTSNNNGFSKGNGGHFNNICPNNCANWTRSNNMYYTTVNNTTEDSWARWLPSIPVGGAVYEVLVYISTVPTTTWKAPYTIVHLDGTTNAVVDQEGSRGHWISIGAYRMLPDRNPANGVYVTDATGEAVATGRRVGADSVKFIRRGTTYAPDARPYSNDWSSSVTIRNNGSGEAKLMVRFVTATGARACTTLAYNLAANAIQGFLCGDSSWASVIVDSTQDISMIVQQQRNNLYTLEAYAGVDKPAAEMWVPIVQKNNNGIYSNLFVQNAGNVNATINLEFFGAAGGCLLTSCPFNNQATLTPGARVVLYTSNYNIGNGFVGSVRITNSANQPLAVASTQYKELYTNGLLTLSQLYETSNSQVPTTTLYAPLVQNNNNAILSGMALRRTGGGSFDVRYYHKDTGAQCAEQLGLPNNPQIIYPAPPTGNNCPTVVTAKLQSGSTMVGNINQLKTSGQATTYAAIATPGRTAIVTKVRRGSGWNDGFAVANFNAGVTNVTVRLYNANGSLNSTPINNQPLNSNGTLVVLGQMPSTFTGSAIVTADQPIVVSVNSLYTGSGDVIGSYPAAHR